MLDNDSCQKSYEFNQTQATTTKVKAFIVNQVHVKAH